MSISITGMSSRMSLKTGCGWAAISGSMPESGVPSSTDVSVSGSMCSPLLLGPYLKKVIDGLHERGVIRLGDDPARREQAGDDGDQLPAVECARGHCGHGVEGIAEPQHQLPPQRR